MKQEITNGVVDDEGHEYATAEFIAAVHNAIAKTVQRPSWSDDELFQYVTG